MKVKYRIKKSDEFAKIIHQRKNRSDKNFVIYFQPKQQAWARVGISVSKKLGNAVVRNKCKRQVRMMINELCNLQEQKFDLIIILKQNYLNLSYADNKKHLETLINKVTIK